MIAINDMEVDGKKDTDVSFVKNKELLEALWEKYASSRSICDRNAIVAANVRLVYAAANSIARRQRPSPGYISAADLTGYGFAGLIEAVERFKPAGHHRGYAGFADYAWRLIAGRIIDGLREDFPPHNRRLARERGTRTTSLDTKIAAARGNDTFANGIDDGTIPDPTVPLAEREELERILRPLDRSMRLVVTLCDVEGLTLRQAAKAVGVEESRACQIRQAAHRLLRERFARRFSR